MKYYIVHTQKSATRETHKKWIPSAHYRSSTEYLLKRMEAEPRNFDFLVVPFILTLCAWLEANLNDWLIVDTFAKHGPRQYKPLAEGYTGTSLAKKLRVAVAVLTDNTFQLRDNSPVVQKLSELIAVRNKITHPLTHYRVGESSETARNSQSDGKHPLHALTIEECRRFYEAVVEFDQNFFNQYDKGYIAENDLIRELERIGAQVAKSSSARKT